MLAETTHDERAEQLFVRDLKTWLAAEVDPAQRRLVEGTAREIGHQQGSPTTQLRRTLYENDAFRSWVGMRRLSQEIMWDAVGSSVDRQLDTLEERAKIAEPKGSLRLQDHFTPPAYVGALDIHMMPGGYCHDLGDGDIRQGAVIDRGGALYMLGRNGGLMNDARGHTLVQYLMTAYPDFQPARILDMGCAVGASTVAIASYFSEAEVHGIDLGGAMLRYAHARAENLGTAIHFAQENAEATSYPDASFDLVVSCVMLHETSNSAVRRIFAETERLLRPGGIAIHCEVPGRVAEAGVWGEVQSDFEAFFNNEPFWRGVQLLDMDQLMQDAGFEQVDVAYQTATSAAKRGIDTRTPASLGPMRSWLMIVGQKPGA